MDAMHVHHGHALTSLGMRAAQRSDALDLPASVRVKMLPAIRERQTFDYFAPWNPRYAHPEIIPD